MSQAEADLHREVYDDGPLYAAAAKIYPLAVRGTFRRLKWAVLIVALCVYYLLPFVRWDRGPSEPHQAVLVDIAHSRFYFFFIELWPQEVYYFTGLLIIAAMTLFLSNALFGRVWCGYACPQTIWSDLFLAIERLIEGDRRERMKLDAAPWGATKIAKRAMKHAAWLLVALMTGGAFTLYLVDAPTLLKNFVTLKAPFTAYVWTGILTFTTYYLAGHMREQLCLYMCPWPRIQAALTDTDALNVTYRRDRGEPRMSLKEAAQHRKLGEAAGDCVDCNKCVQACPNGIDIRKGSQLGCVQCALCIDACDEVMAKIGRPTRLIAYDTDENMLRRARGETPVYRLIRPRTILYAAIVAIVGLAMLFALSTRKHMNLSVLHVRAPMYTLAHDVLRNGYTLRFGNKANEPRRFELSVSGLPDITLKSDAADALPDGRLSVTVDPDATQEILLYVSTRRANMPGNSAAITMSAKDVKTGEAATVTDHFFGP